MTPRGHTPLWLVFLVATWGFVFDQYEILTLPLVIAPALREFLDAGPGSAEYTRWVGLLFWIPAICGGLFGLVGGYIADRFGRRRVLVWSIVIYAAGAVASAYSTSALMFLICRCVILVGVCVEFVAGIAWLAELYADSPKRERVLGLSQAISSLGGLLVTGVFLYLIVPNAGDFPAIAGGHDAWRYTCLSGVVAALPLLVVRPFLPESPLWRPTIGPSPLARIKPLFSGALAANTWKATVATAASYGLAYGAMQHSPRLAAGWPGLADEAARLGASGTIQMVQEMGGLTGRLLLVALAVTLISRQRLLRGLQLAALVAFPVTFAVLTRFGFGWFQVGIFCTAAITAAQLSFWGNYLPRVFPTSVRATGESVAINLGGRMIGTSAAYFNGLVTATFATSAGATAGLAYAAAAVATVACVLGLASAWRLAEPASSKLPD